MTADEWLDVLDAAGEPIGTKRRADVHRDGNWHAAFHLWVVSGDQLLLQRRGAQKQAWPQMLDATAAGHLAAGESALDGLREAEEELGIRYQRGALTLLGVFRVDENHGDGTTNREFQHVYAVRDNRPLNEFTAIDRAELEGLVGIHLRDFGRLLEGTDVPGIAWDGARAEATMVRRAELVPAPYLQQIAEHLAAV